MATRGTVPVGIRSLTTPNAPRLLPDSGSSRNSTSMFWPAVARSTSSLKRASLITDAVPLAACKVSIGTMGTPSDRVSSKVALAMIRADSNCCRSCSRR